MTAQRKKCQMKIKTITVLALFITSATAWSDTYIRTGGVTGTVCSGLGIEVCDSVTLVAAEGDDGEYFSIAERFPSVNEYSERRQRCTLYVKSSGLGLLSRGMNLFSQKFYYRDEQGYLKGVKPDYITFPCRKVK